jgi:hypothetical protein
VSQSDVIAAANVLMVAVMKATRMIVSKFSQLPAMRQVPGVDGITVGLTNSQRAQRRGDAAPVPPAGGAGSGGAGGGGGGGVPTTAGGGGVPTTAGGGGGGGGPTTTAPGGQQQQQQQQQSPVVGAAVGGQAALHDFVKQARDRQRIIETNEMVGVFYALAIWYTIIVVIVLTVYGMSRGESIVFCFTLLATALVSEVDILSRQLSTANADPLGRHV